MADSLADTMGAWRAFTDGLGEFADRMAVLLAADAKEMVNTRIVERGEAADGSALVNAKSGTLYSPTPFPSGFFANANPPLKPEQAKRTSPFLDYQEYKERVGRYRGKRDMTLTGRMWKNTGLVSKSVTKGGFVAVVAGRNTETQEKLDSNSRTAGVDALEMSASEQAELSLTLDGELQIYMNSSGL